MKDVVLNAFLKPNKDKPAQSKFPICRKVYKNGNANCEPKCSGIISAYIRARQYKYRKVASKARALSKKYECEKKYKYKSKSRKRKRKSRSRKRKSKSRKRSVSRKRSDVSHKIKKLLKEGYGQKQAVAIALSMKRAGTIGPRGGYAKKPVRCVVLVIDQKTKRERKCKHKASKNRRCGHHQKK